MSKQAETIATPGKEQWQVIGESSSYWDVAAKIDGLVAPSQTLSEVAYSPVCRVSKHAPGKAYLAMVLAAPDLLTACENYLYGRKDSRECEAEMRSAVHKARGTTP